MSLKPLEAFRAVAVTGSTTAAAASLDLSQSAVSRLIAQLEREMGLELFRRERGRLVPTPEALRLLDPVSDAIEGMRRVGRIADGLRLGFAGQVLVRLAVPHSVAEGILPPVLAQFLADFPDASVELLTGGYPVIERMVASGEADFGLVGLPTAYPGLVTEKLATVGNVVVLPAGHALAAKAAVDPQDLAEEALVMIGRQQTFRLSLERAFRRAGVSPRVRVEAHSVAAACALVAAGLGLTIVNGLMAGGFRRMGLETRPFQPRIDQEFGLAHAEGRPRPKLADRLAERIRQLLRQGPGETDAARTAGPGSPSPRPAPTAPPGR